MNADDAPFEATPTQKLNILDAYDGEEDDISAQLRRRASTEFSESKFAFISIPF